MITEQVIEVVVFDDTGARVDTAEANTPEAALFAGQTLYDEAMVGYKQRGSVGFYVDGKLSRVVHGRPL